MKRKVRTMREIERVRKYRNREGMIRGELNRATKSKAKRHSKGYKGSMIS